VQSLQHPKGKFVEMLHKNTTYDVKIVKISPPIFLHSSPFYSTPKILCFTMLFNWLDTTKSAPPLGGIYTPSNMFLRPTRLSIPNNINCLTALLL